MGKTFDVGRVLQLNAEEFEDCPSVDVTIVAAGDRHFRFADGDGGGELEGVGAVFSNLAGSAGVLVGYGVSAGEVGENCGGREASEIVDMDAADEVGAIAVEGVLALSHRDVDAAVRPVNGCGAEDQGLPGALLDGGFCVGAGLFAGIARGDGCGFIDVLRATVYARCR